MRVVDMKTGREAKIKTWDGSGWVTAATGPGRRAPRTVNPPAGAPVKNIAGGCAYMNSPVSGIAKTGAMVAARIPVVVDVLRPVAEFDIQMTDNVARVMEIKAAVAVGDDAPVPVTFNGGEPVARVERPAVPGIVHVKTDPLPISANAGEVLTWYGFAGATDGGRAQGDQVGYLPGVDLWYAPGENFEQAWNGVRFSSPNNENTPMFPAARPARILAPTNKPAWVLTGDSIMHFSRPHVQRWAIAAGVAWAKNATGGRNYIHATNDYATLYRPSVKSATMCFDELGINGANFTLGLDHWRKLRADGIQGIVKSTLTPQTTSRDGWRTVEGQTAVSDVPGFLKWDAWLLDGAPMKRDWSAVVEAGATGEDIVRCAVVDGDGKLVRKGDPAHVFGTGGVVDWNPSVSLAGSTPGGNRRIWRMDLGLKNTDYGDGLHPGDGIHEVMARYLVKAMPVVLDSSARVG
jgi:hypothetical protein|nr:MAG TPA: hypothetical protein [Caudoviricetes sp.]